MKRTIPTLLLALVICWQSTTGDDNTTAWHRELSRWGLPQFKTITEAITFVTNENDFLSYHGPTEGSDWFPITMPSGKTNNNWYVGNVFSLVFAGFGKECIPSLIDLLDNDALYVRYGAYVVLQQKAGRYDDRYDFKINTRQQRHAGVQAWRDWWSKNENNTRLDYPPKRVYEAKKWDEGK